MRRLCVRTMLFAGFIAAPLLPGSAPASSGLCESADLGNGYFRAYSEPKPVSKQAFTGEEGEQVRLDSLPGPRALLVNFWTTWCTPCREEMPSMDRLQGRVSPQRLLILPLVRDGKGLSEAIRFYRTYDIVNLPVAADRFGKIAHDHHVGALPQTLLVDSRGLVRGVLVGGVDWESEAVLELLGRCLQVKVEKG
jgi:thiol-disulfide isomerase/thioredoxin